jgi:hypothetical protein
VTNAELLKAIRDFRGAIHVALYGNGSNYYYVKAVKSDLLDSLCGARDHEFSASTVDSVMYIDVVP